MSQEEDPKGKEEVEATQLEGSDEEEQSVSEAFEAGWNKFRTWVQTNAHLVGPDYAQLLIKAICTKGSAFAMLTLSAALVKPQKGQTNPFREAIEERNFAGTLGVRELLSGHIDLTNVNLPVEIVDKGFDYGNFFIECLDELE